MSDAGFSAAWSTTRLATNMLHQLFEHLRNNRPLDTLIGVRFVDPTDSYTQTDRAIKYGLLFIGLTFAAFFLFEVLKRLAIHPFQYGLAGTALVLFYLLPCRCRNMWALGSPTRSPPPAAWRCWPIISAMCWIAWVGVWVSGADRCGVRDSVRVDQPGGSGAAGRLGDAVWRLALVMTLTRKVDWYQLGKRWARRGKGLDGV